MIRAEKPRILVAHSVPTALYILTVSQSRELREYYGDQSGNVAPRTDLSKELAASAEAANWR